MKGISMQLLTLQQRGIVLFSSFVVIMDLPSGTKRFSKTISSFQPFRLVHLPKINTVGMELHLEQLGMAFQPSVSMVMIFLRSMKRP